MSNMNGRTRKKLYDFLCKRDGEYCRGCGKLPWEGQLVVDHKDNDNSNNSPENLQLLCRACNYIKNPRPLDTCVSYDNESIRINKSKEPKFREYVYHRLDAERVLVYEDVLYSGSEMIGVSPETAKRYLRKMCSKQGKLEVFMDWDSLNLVYAKRVKSIRYKTNE